VLTGGLALLLMGAIFTSGMQLGRFITGTLRSEALAQEIDQQRLDLQAARGQLQGKVDALASRVGTLNAHLIRLDALGRRITDLANLDRGEFNFDKPPPAGGRTVGTGGRFRADSELTMVLDTLGSSGP
jgi:outer membrane murein-binding lipoprotein Lpp